MDQDTKNVVEGEVVPKDSAASATASSADTLLTITSLITNYLAQIDRSQKELAEQRQMLEDAFNNDLTFKEHNDAVKAASKIRNATKAQILKQPQLVAQAEKVKDLREEIKAAKEALSGYLQEYAQMTNSRTFEGPDGILREIVYIAKLVNSTSKSG